MREPPLVVLAVLAALTPMTIGGAGNEAGASESVGVCECVISNTGQRGPASRASRRLVVRGAGRFNRDGFVLFDYTCSLQESPPVPAAVLVVTSPPAEASRALLQFRMLRSSARENELFQGAFLGDLTCVKDFKPGGFGNAVKGTGYGGWGNIPCQMTAISAGAIRSVR